jgi:hypothetical protein
MLNDVIELEVGELVKDDDYVLLQAIQACEVCRFDELVILERVD